MPRKKKVVSSKPYFFSPFPIFFLKGLLNGLPHVLNHPFTPWWSLRFKQKKTENQRPENPRALKGPEERHIDTPPSRLSLY